jgi:hypothetical protein
VCVDVRAIHPAPLAATKSCSSRLQMVRQAWEKMPEGVKKNEIVADSPGRRGCRGEHRNDRGSDQIGRMMHFQAPR